MANSWKCPEANYSAVMHLSVAPRGYFAGKQGKVPGWGQLLHGQEQWGNHTLGAAHCHRLSSGDTDTPSPPLSQPRAGAARGLFAEGTLQGSAGPGCSPGCSGMAFASSWALPTGAGRRGPAPDPCPGWIQPIPWAPLALSRPMPPAQGQNKASASLANRALVHLRTVPGQMLSPKLANSLDPLTSRDLHH